MNRIWNSKAFMAAAMVLMTSSPGCLKPTGPSENAVPPRSVCGNDKAQSGEKCDGVDLKDKS
jgi:hypothetical protein